MSDIIKTLEWAIHTIQDQEMFGRDELGAAKAREKRAKGVMFDAIDEIKLLQAHNKRLEGEMEKLLVDNKRLYGYATKNFGYYEHWRHSEDRVKKTIEKLTSIDAYMTMHPCPDNHYVYTVLNEIRTLSKQLQSTL